MANKVTAAERLLDMIERVERLKEEIKGIQEDVKDVFGEAKSNGFDPAAMKTVIKLRKMTPDARRDSLGMVEVYMQALGMGDGGLSDLAAKFLEERSAPPEPFAPGKVDQDVPEFSSPSVSKKKGDRGALEEATIDVVELSLEDATRLGANAHAAGKPVTANPFPARDPRRAAWDTAWCAASGSDGMDVPEHLMSASALEAKRKAAAAAAAADTEAAAAAEARKAELSGEPLEVARRLVVKSQNGSTAWLQRAMEIGYSDAAVLLDLLQRDGVVSGPDIRGKREVLEAAPEGDDDADA